MTSNNQACRFKRIISTGVAICAICVSQSYHSHAKSPRLGLDLGVRTEYVSNLFNLDEIDRDLFSANMGAGERFEGMESVDDIRMPLSAEAWARWKIAKKRYLKLSLLADYNIHLENSIADYWKFRARIAFDLTRKNSIRLGVRFVPDRFKKNYKVYTNDPATYQGGYYDEMRASAEYRYDFGGRNTLGLDYTYADRTYNEVFSGRDRKQHTIEGNLEKSLSDNVTLMLEAGFGSADTEDDWNVPAYMAGSSRDRSFNEYLAGAGLNIDLPHRWWIDLGFEYSLRDYTTDNTIDALYYSRQDRKLVFSGSVEKRLKNGLDIYVYGEYADKTGSQDLLNTLEGEEGDYTRGILGAGLEYGF